ncbi:hypothetical protein VTO42DRAFT_8017 [Malbranchea cinnamomea]
MEGLFTLLSLSLLMAIGSFVVGSLPLTFSLSSSQLRLISALGMGVLVGTSLIVIIPEGVETLYSSTTLQPHAHPHRRRDMAAKETQVRWEQSSGPFLIPRDGSDEESSLDVSAAVADDEDLEPIFTGPDDPGEAFADSSGRSSDENEDSGNDKEDPKAEQRSPHAWIGVGLVSGFLLMYLIDELPQFATPSSNQQQRTYHISLDNLSSGLERGVSPARRGFLGFNTGSTSRNRAFATTTGLVVHAAADGIALGASSSSTSLSFIIFIAIMVHKAPASFGLTSVLLKQGLSTRAARAHLLVFSLAAPVGAFLTWLVAHTIMAGHVGDEQGTRWRTGMLLLFSAGTFLYVAMHTMQDNAEESSRRDSNANGYFEGRESSQPAKKSLRDLIASVIGMLIPLFLQIGHAH